MKTIFITGATDGIGLATAKLLAAQGHKLILHGRNTTKLENVIKSLNDNNSSATENIQGVVADLSDLKQVNQLAEEICSHYSSIDVVINNAGIFRLPDPSQSTTVDGLDIRLAVNTYAPYILTQKLMPLLQANKDTQSRVVNLSSAAQAPVNLNALLGKVRFTDEFDAYAQSKLAITMWSNALAQQYDNAPMIVSVNPGSMLASKMVKEGFGVAGNDISIGADILVRAALSDEFNNAAGKYYDNDSKCFSPPHLDALNTDKVREVVNTIESFLNQ